MQSEVGEENEPRTRGKAKWLATGLVGLLAVAGLAWGLNMGGADSSGSEASNNGSTTTSSSDSAGEGTGGEGASGEGVVDEAADEGALQQKSDDPGPQVSNVSVGQGEEVPKDEATDLEAALDETKTGLSQEEVTEVESSVEKFEADDAELMTEKEEKQLDESVAKFEKESSAPDEPADEDSAKPAVNEKAVDALSSDADSQIDDLKQLTDDVTAEVKP